MYKSAVVLLFVILSSELFAQSFKVQTKGAQTFNFQDSRGRNQVTFFSKAPLEDITGTANDISGTVSFDITNFVKTLKGKIVVKVASMKSGIELRDTHLKGTNWLDEKKYPEISFEIKSIEGVKQIADNKLEFNAKGDFTLHGVTKEISANVEATYLDESEQTKKRAPGDLFGIRASFKVKLSDFDIDNAIIGNKVAEDIEVSVNIVGSNKQ
jgi:polyisoprenoid-binding protein YceI